MLPDTEDDGEDDVGQRLVYSLVKAGLSDSEMDVRDVACDVLAFLPEEERATLSLHLLDHEDVALRTRILAESLDYDDEAALTINFHALDADDKSLREMASANLIEKTGLVFETADEAFDWYENQQMAKSCLESDVD